MTASNDPIYTQLAFAGTAVVTGANASLGDAGDANIVEVTWSDPTVAGNIESDGAQLVALSALPRATTTPTALYLYLSLDGGTTKRLIAATTAAGISVTATTAPSSVTFSWRGGSISETNPLYLPPGSGAAKARLYVGASVALAAGWVFVAQGLRLTKAVAS